MIIRQKFGVSYQFLSFCLPTFSSENRANASSKILDMPYSNRRSTFFRTKLDVTNSWDVGYASKGCRDAREYRTSLCTIIPTENPSGNGMSSSSSETRSIKWVLFEIGTTANSASIYVRRKSRKRPGLCVTSASRQTYWIQLKKLKILECHILGLPGRILPKLELSPVWERLIKLVSWNISSIILCVDLVNGSHCVLRRKR